jgi:GNAT superfamily N-acetyltransferase
MDIPLPDPFEIRDLSSASDGERQAVIDQIRAGLVAHNLSKQPDATSEPILLALYTAETLLGGLAGRITWDWLRIEFLWIAEEARGSGVGRELMRRAERRARRTRHDTMDPEHMEWMADAVQNGRYLHCPNGSHLAMYDDQQVFFQGLVEFVRDVDAGRF